MTPDCTGGNHVWLVDFGKGDVIESGQPCKCGKRRWPGPKLSTEEARAAVALATGKGQTESGCGAEETEGQTDG